MKILGRHTSYNVQKVLWFADELSLQYTHEEVGGRFGGNDTPEFLALNPLGKVPVLVTDQGAVRESNTILRYLADRFAPDTFIPTDPYSRSVVESWMDWSIDTLEPAFIGVFWGYYRTPEKQRDHAAIAIAVKRTENLLMLMENSLSKKSFLVSDTLTLADVAIGVFIHRLVAIDLTIKIPSNVDAWYQRLTERPSYKRWVMSDFAELQGRSGF